MAGTAAIIAAVLPVVTLADTLMSPVVELDWPGAPVESDRVESECQLP